MQRYGLVGARSWATATPRMLHAHAGDITPTTSYQVGAGGGWMRFCATTELAGMNVTIPYKKAVDPVLQGACLRQRRRIGSVNTLVRRADGWYGDNTDYDGFLLYGPAEWYCHRWEEGSGAGQRRRQPVTASSRPCGTWGRGRPSSSPARGPDNYQNLARHADAQIIANATPVGMYPNNGASPLDLAGFPRLEGVLDLIYNPARTAPAASGGAPGHRLQWGARDAGGPGKAGRRALHWPCHC